MRINQQCQRLTPLAKSVAPPGLEKMLPVVLGLTPQAMNLSPLRGWYLLTDMDTVADAPGYESVAPAGLEPPPDTTTSWNYWEAAKRRKTFSLGREPQDGNVFP